MMVASSRSVTRSTVTAVRTGPLKGLPEFEEIVFDWVSWYNNERLHSFLGNVSPEEYERNYYADTTGPSADEAANKTAA